jgi:hypothetical protein
MQFLTYGISGLFWLVCYGVAIWICVVGKKKNPNKGWNLIVAAETIYIVVLLPPLYYNYLFFKLPIMFLLRIAKEIHYISWLLFLPMGMVLSLVGLYYIAQGKKGKFKKAVKKRRNK